VQTTDVSGVQAGDPSRGTSAMAADGHVLTQRPQPKHRVGSRAGLSVSIFFTPACVKRASIDASAAAYAARQAVLRDV